MAAKKEPAKRQIGMVTTPEEFERLKAKSPKAANQQFRQLWPKQKETLIRNESEICIGGAKAGGKGQPLHAKILTPFGWTKMGELRVGSLISNPTGGTSYVIGIFPLGEREIFRVTFSDGATTLVTDDHLWLARLSARVIKADRRYFPFADEDRVDAKVYTTKWLKEYIDRERGNHPTRDKNGNGASAVLVPLTEPVEYSPGKKSWGQTVDPYVLGALLGDGCLRNGQIGISSNDSKIIDLIRSRTGLELRHVDGCDWKINGAMELRAELGKLGVYGCLSHQKFIPEIYKWASVSDRWELIQGLMDTDGYADARGHCSFTSVSERLADDVREVLWSLGFKVTKTCGPAGYRNDAGEFVQCRDAYTLYIQGRRMEHLFKLERKSGRVIGNRKPHPASSMRRMVSIELVGKERAQCIQVDHPNSLYITDDYIVTHNTITGIYFLLKGNAHADACPAHKGLNCACPFPDNDSNDNPILVNRSYIYHPKYLGCVIRRNATDLLDWVREAKEIYGLIGGDFKEGKNRFEFPSGAIIFCGHYDEENAYMKYQGMNIVRFLLEEATQIPDVKRLKMLKSCCRSVYPEMRAQMLLTCNPGGPGHGWVLDRYVEPTDENGDIIPPGTPIVESFENPFKPGEIISSTRVFIFSSIKDNPAAVSNKEYIASLMSLDEEERRAYLFGDWHAMSGEFFSSWRPKGPKHGEPAEANHVVPHNFAIRRIKPWWWRTMAMDYGYAHECATLWGCHDQETDQFWVTDELVVSETEPDIIGEEVGRRTKKILEGLETPMISMGLSHDAYGLRQDDRSVAELIARGIARVLGPNMVHVPDLMVDKLKDQMEAAGQSTGTSEADAIFQRIRSQQRMGITIRRMRDNRVVGWQLIRTLMRWRQTLPEVKDIFDPNLASQIAYEKGLEAYGSYVNLFKQKREILPKLQVIGPPIDSHGRPDTSQMLGCPRLMGAIPKAQHDELNPEDVSKKHFTGMDSLDALRYLLLTFRGQSMPEPFQALRQRKVAEAMERNPNYDTADLIWVNRHVEDAWATRHAAQTKPIHVIRAGRGMRARVKGLLPGPQ
jgi:hypothetical protein